jgi:hypothetical protein
MRVYLRVRGSSSFRRQTLSRSASLGCYAAVERFLLALVSESYVEEHVIIVMLQRDFVEIFTILESTVERRLSE